MKAGFCYAVALGGLLSLSASSARAQMPTAAKPDTTTGKPIARRKVPTAADSARLTEKLLGMRLTRPAKAGWLALLFPGAGQVYNHSYWKLPLVYGGIGAVTATGLLYQSRYKEYARSLAIWKRDGSGINDPGPRSSKETSEQNVNNGLSSYRTQRDAFIGYTALVYGITVLDAIVDAHLRDFDVSDELSLRCQPSLQFTNAFLPAPGLSVALHFTTKVGSQPLP